MNQISATLATGDGQDYEVRYNPRIAVPEYASHFEKWAELSEQARAQMDGYLDVPYGSTAMEKLDIFRAQGNSRALLMFIHGGYWRALDKSQHTFVALPFVRAGATVAVVNYALCPAVTVEDIVRQILQATAWLYRNGANFGAPAGPLYVAGHSAGGHLTAMMLAAQWPKFAADLPPKVVRAALSISGLFDLAPIVKTASVNVDVRLDPITARRASPALMPPATDAPLTLAVGGKEQAGFHEQHALIKRKWAKVIAGEVPCPDDNHFSILERFADPQSQLCKATCRMMGLE
ncbi:MAG TPA: alpha/beta hydrolase [Burkholderiales bacterium]|nr:alpha/beta hydrolase [Burkholderiales bacterium]